jgi:hypothetical protein
MCNCRSYLPGISGADFQQEHPRRRGSIYELRAIPRTATKYSCLHSDIYANEVRDILPSYCLVYDYHGVEICDTCWIVVGVGVGSIGETAKRGVGHVNQGGIKSRSNCKTCVTWL